MEYFGIVGGDLRIAKLAELLAKENTVNVYGINSEYIHRTFNDKGFSNIRFSGLEETIYESDYIISSIPFTKSGQHINTPLFDGKIFIKDFIDSLGSDKTLIAGKIDENIQDILIKKDVRFVDLLEIEDLTIKNCIPTAEGAIQIAMQESTTTLHDSNILILGYGRIGKILSHMLLGFGCNIYCEARKESDLAYINAYGYIPVRLSELSDYLEEFDYIFNTIPNVILDKNKLKLVKKDVLIIDLASSPGGVDFDAARSMGIRAIAALSLPGLVAPFTSAKYLYETILGDINISKNTNEKGKIL